MADDKKIPQHPRPEIQKPKPEAGRDQTRTYSDKGDFSKVKNREIVDTSTTIKKGADSNALSTKASKTD